MGCIRLSILDEQYKRCEQKMFAVKSVLTSNKTTLKVSNNYFFGFNGQEKDNEIKGTGNSLNYQARIQDTRLGRFLSVDPLTKSFPWYSSYQFAGNTPIQAIDLDGAEEMIVTTRLSDKKMWNTFIKKINSTEIHKEFEKTVKDQNNFDVFYYTFEYERSKNDNKPQGASSKTKVLNGGKADELYVTDYTQNTENNLSDEDKKLLTDKLKSGKKIIMIGLNKSELEDAAIEYGVTGKKEGAIGVGESILHEEDAHAKRVLNNTAVDEKTEHKDYHGDYSDTSPSVNEIKNDPKYKNTRAREAVNQVEKALDK